MTMWSSTECFDQVLLAPMMAVVDDQASCQQKTLLDQTANALYTRCFVRKKRLTGVDVSNNDQRNMNLFFSHG